MGSGLVKNFLIAGAFTAVMAPIGANAAGCGYSQFVDDESETPLIQVADRKPLKAEKETEEKLEEASTSEEGDTDEMTPLENILDDLACIGSQYTIDPADTDSLVLDEEKQSTIKELQTLARTRSISVDFQRNGNPGPVKMLVKDKNVSIVFNPLLSDPRNGEAGDALLTELYTRTVDGEPQNGVYFYSYRNNTVTFKATPAVK